MQDDDTADDVFHPPHPKRFCDNVTPKSTLLSISVDALRRVMDFIGPPSVQSLVRVGNSLLTRRVAHACSQLDIRHRADVSYALNESTIATLLTFASITHSIGLRRLNLEQCIVAEASVPLLNTVLGSLSNLDSLQLKCDISASGDILLPHSLKSLSLIYAIGRHPVKFSFLCGPLIEHLSISYDDVISKYVSLESMFSGLKFDRIHSLELKRRKRKSEPGGYVYCISPLLSPLSLSRFSSLSTLRLIDCIYVADIPPTLCSLSLVNHLLCIVSDDQPSILTALATVFDRNGILPHLETIELEGGPHKEIKHSTLSILQMLSKHAPALRVFNVPRRCALVDSIMRGGEDQTQIAKAIASMPCLQSLPIHLFGPYSINQGIVQSIPPAILHMLASLNPATWVADVDVLSGSARDASRWQCIRSSRACIRSGASSSIIMPIEHAMFDWMRSNGSWLQSISLSKIQFPTYTPIDAIKSLASLKCLRISVSFDRDETNGTTTLEPADWYRQTLPPNLTRLDIEQSSPALPFAGIWLPRSLKLLFTRGIFPNESFMNACGPSLFNLSITANIQCADFEHVAPPDLLLKPLLHEKADMSLRLSMMPCLPSSEHESSRSTNDVVRAARQFYSGLMAGACMISSKLLNASTRAEGTVCKKATTMTFSAQNVLQSDGDQPVLHAKMATM